MKNKTTKNKPLNGFKIAKRLAVIGCTIPLICACFMGNGNILEGSEENVQVHAFGTHQELLVSETPANYNRYDLPYTISPDDSEPIGFYSLLPAINAGAGGAVRVNTDYDSYTLAVSYYAENSDSSMDDVLPFITWRAYDILMPLWQYSAILADVNMQIYKQTNTSWRPPDNEVSIIASLNLRNDSGDINNVRGDLVYPNSNRIWYSDFLPSATDVDDYKITLLDGNDYIYIDSLSINIYFPANAYNTEFILWDTTAPESGFFPPFLYLDEYLTNKEYYLDYLTDIGFNTNPTQFIWNTFDGFLSFEVVPGLTPRGLLFIGLVFAVLTLVVKLLLHRG